MLQNVVNQFSIGHLRMAHRDSNDPKGLAREWLQTLIDKSGESARAIAIKAEVSPSTIYRALDPDSDFTPTTTTLDKIAKAWNVPMPHGFAAPHNVAAGLAEPEMRPLEGTPTQALRPENNNQSNWMIRTRALELAGVMMNDIVTVDMSVNPRSGDIVCAQVYNFDRGAADTLIRLYNPPYIVAKTMDPALDDEPLLVDGRRVAIVGTVVQVLRNRAA